MSDTQQGDGTKPAAMAIRKEGSSKIRCAVPCQRLHQPKDQQTAMPWRQAAWPAPISLATFLM